MENFTLKKELVGEMKSPPSGDYQPTREKLTVPLEGTGSCMFGFCEGCGFVRQITVQGKAVFETELGLMIPDPPADTYLHFARCLHCDEQFQGAEVRNIPE